MCTTLRYIHRVELLCDEDKTRFFNEEVDRMADIRAEEYFSGLDEDTDGEQHVDP